MHTFKKFLLGMVGTAFAAGMLAVMPLTSLAAGDIAINETNFPDAKLREFLLSQDYGSDGKITQAEIPNVKQIYFFGEPLADVKGIEFFPDLEMLKAYECKLTSIDVSKNPKLQILNLEGNTISDLDVSMCKDLTELKVSGNKLTKIDVSGLKSLKTLVIGGNPLTEFKAAGCTSLEGLNLDENQLQKIDVSDCTSMSWLVCRKNELTSLNVSGCTAMDRLECSENKLTALDVSGCSALEELVCDTNKLTSINLEGCTALQSFVCHDNEFSKLDLSKYSNLTYIDCSNNQLKNGALILSSSVTDVVCENNLFTEIDFAEAKSLESLNCDNNKLTSLKVSNNPKLKYLVCNETGIKTLDLSKNTGLLTLRCNHNNLTALNLENNKKAYMVECQFNSITSLSFPAGSAITILACNDNKLTTIGLSNAESLFILKCHNNSLKEIDISQCEGLITAYTKGTKTLSDDKKIADYYLNTATSDDDGAVVDEGDEYELQYDVSAKINAEALKLDKNSAQIVCGKTLTLKATPKTKSAKVTWTSSDKNIATVDKSGKITAKMAGKVTITATASGAIGKCVITVLYKDVKDSKNFWFTPTNELTALGIVKGYDKQTKFKPANECTRAQMVTFLYRLQGEPEVKSSTCKFPDVKSTDYFFKPVIWAVENGITTGYGDGKFKPQNVCTRAQTVTFLWRMAGEPEPWKKKTKFSDVKEGDYFYIPVIWASEKKIVAGYDDGTFKPQGKCLRRQMVTFLYKYQQYMR